ncbi:MAG: hypothetical protein Q9163_005900 [Psora crenata]
MSQTIRVDEPYSTPGEDNPDSQRSGNPRTSSEPEVRSDSEDSGSTTSVSGSTKEEQILENSRYYCNATYFMPNDSTEQTRLKVAYQTYLPILDGQLTLGLIPSRSRRILDIGTGTGDWAIAVAERFPQAEIYATDITSAFHPTNGPPNIFFELDDARDEWTYAEPFDFIHIRELGGAFQDWGKIYTEVSRHLKLGGNVEVVDHSRIQLTEEPENSYIGIYNTALESAAEKAGTPLNLDHLKGPMFERVGLSVTKTKSLDIPLGTWSPDPRKKVAGKMALISALEGLEAVSLRLLTKWQGWTEEAVRDLCKKVTEEVLRPDARAYMKLQFVVARKMGV